MTQPQYCNVCGGQLEPDADDPLLPDHIEPLECPVCGERYLLDQDTGAVEVDA